MSNKYHRGVLEGKIRQKVSAASREVRRLSDAGKVAEMASEVKEIKCCYDVFRTSGFNEKETEQPRCRGRR